MAVEGDHTGSTPMFAIFVLRWAPRLPPLPAAVACRRCLVPPLPLLQLSYAQGRCY